MSFAEGLPLAYLKVGVPAAAIIGVLWLVGRGAVGLYRWERDAADAAPPKETSDAGAAAPETLPRAH